MLLDVVLPDLSGLEVLKRYRGEGGLAPVIVLSASIPISPQGAGVMEAFAILLTQPQGATVSQGLALALSIRAVQILWNLTGGIFVLRGGYSAPTAGQEPAGLVAYGYGYAPHSIETRIGARIARARSLVTGPMLTTTGGSDPVPTASTKPRPGPV